MKLLALTRYDTVGASSRLRFFQYLQYITSEGITVNSSPLFFSNYLYHLYNHGSRPIVTLIKAYFKRAFQAHDFNSYDVLWIEKELFPWLPAVEEFFLSKVKTPYIIDYDDAVYHLYDKHSRKIVRTILGKKIDKIMSHASVVTVGNEYLGKRAINSGARKVITIPTVVDLQRYKIKQNNSGLFTIGWIGTPITEKFLTIVKEPIQQIAKKSDVQLSLVGASPRALNNLKPKILKWTVESEVRMINSFDVGIMPLYDNPFERGKCGYKLIQYMACGKPVVASPVGVNKSIIDHGLNGFLAKSKEDWVYYLNVLKNDKDLRDQMGKNARKKVEKKYSLSANSPLFCRAIIDSLT